MNYDWLVPPPQYLNNRVPLRMGLQVPSPSTYLPFFLKVGHHKSRDMLNAQAGMTDELMGIFQICLKLNGTIALQSSMWWKGTPRWSKRSSSHPKFEFRTLNASTDEYFQLDLAPTRLCVNFELNLPAI
jgi:hypothetical protein